MFDVRNCAAEIKAIYQTILTRREHSAGQTEELCTQGAATT
jgi:hypothetical protein